MSEHLRLNLHRLGVLLMALFLPILVRAQLVADGQTNILSGVVSNVSQVIVGTNGSFTLLLVTNGSVLTITNGLSGVLIGGGSAESNRLIVTGSQLLGPEVVVGGSGSGNELDILNGGIVSGFGRIGFDPGANSNLVLVSGSGSAWTNDENGEASVVVGDVGSFNTLVVSNGGQVFSGGGAFSGISVSAASGSSNNSAIVTGSGSLWSAASTVFNLGGNNNTSSNSLLVTDSGTFTGTIFYVGFEGNYNQLTVSNSGVVSVGNLYVGYSPTSGKGSATIDGGTLVVSNVANLYTGSPLTLNSGLFAASSLTCFSGGQLIFNGGTLQSGSTSYGGTAPFVVGDGTDTATYTMLGGGHSFRGLVISSNAVLNGSGTITAIVSVNNGGTIAPGTNNLATIVLNGALTLNPGSTTLMNLNASDSTSDTITGMSNLVYGGTLQLTNVSGFYSDGQSFSLFTATNYSGAFAALMPASPGAGLRWDTNELSVDGVLRVFSTTTPPPVFGSITVANGNLLISASAGIPYDPCYLLTSTNLAAPISDWLCITTNYFDLTGATTFTNAISTDQTQQYFRLQVN